MTKSSHRCEPWTFALAPDGHVYCRACGENLPSRATENGLEATEVVQGRPVLVSEVVLVDRSWWLTREGSPDIALIAFRLGPLEHGERKPRWEVSLGRFVDNHIEYGEVEIAEGPKEASEIAKGLLTENSVGKPVSD